MPLLLKLGGQMVMMLPCPKLLLQRQQIGMVMKALMTTVLNSSCMYKCNNNVISITASFEPALWCMVALPALVAMHVLYLLA